MSASRSTELLIVGAGPFGLAMAARARHLDIDHVIVGEPMYFWRAHMPDGMYLRSDCSWHLDPQAVDTIDAFLHTRGMTAADATPVPRDLYLQYAGWFQARQQIDPCRTLVERLDPGDRHHRFRAALGDGSTIDADYVVLALGFAPFAHVPEELACVLPAGGVHHTCDLVDFTGLRGRRCLIVGGRQSAFEWAALMAEAGAAAVHVSHRHHSPAFAAADWSWVDPLVNRMVEEPGWYMGLSQAEKDRLGRRLWAEGRLKLEPWLAERIRRDGISVWPNTRVTRCSESGRALAVTLDTSDGDRVLEVDRIVLATGYNVNVARVPCLARGTLLAGLRTDNGLPVLDAHMQSSIPGLFMTSMLATRDFGPFLAFTVSVRASARLMSRVLRPGSD